MAGNGERLDVRSAVLPEDARSTWTPGRPVRRALIAAYLLTLAALATVGWIEALHGGARESDPTRTLWVALLIATLVQVALLNKATHGQFTLRLHQLDEHQRAVRDRGGYRYGFRILASAATALLAVALSLPVDRLLGATNRMAWSAVAIVCRLLDVDAAHDGRRVDGTGSPASRLTMHPHIIFAGWATSGPK
jgi:hypothetical protein